MSNRVTATFKADFFKIETGVPIPEQQRAKKQWECPYPFAAMNIGDSFFIPSKKATMASIKQSLYDASNKFRKAFAPTFYMRIVEIKDAGKGGLRVWRVEQKDSRPGRIKKVTTQQPAPQETTAALNTSNHGHVAAETNYL